MVSGPPTTATAMLLMPMSAQVCGSGCSPGSQQVDGAGDTRPPNRAPMNTEAKNRPPRKPEPIDTAEATDLAQQDQRDLAQRQRAFRAARRARRGRRRAPADRAVPRPPTMAPPSAGRRPRGTPVPRKSALGRGDAQHQRRSRPARPASRAPAGAGSWSLPVGIAARDDLDRACLWPPAASATTAPARALATTGASAGTV